MLFFSIIVAVVSYLIGSIPTAYVLVKAVKGIDIRTVGSGNVGATNAGRAIGGWAFIAVLILDALKGYLPVYLTMRYCFSAGYSIDIALISALCVILGHTFSVFLNFKGGKGVATSLGVFLALAPLAVLIALVVFIILVGATRMISVGSIGAAITIAIAVFFLSNWQWLWVFTWVLAAFVIIKHRTNITRILAGTENKVKFGNGK